MRDTLKNNDYFIRQINSIHNALSNSLLRLKSGQIKANRINIVKRSYVYDYVLIISCKYSAGYPVNELKEDLLNAINLTYESWDGFWKIKDMKGKELNQYTLSGYDQMIWMLSLGYLLNIPNEDFQKLVDVIDRDCVKDFLFEFIIQAKIKDRQPIAEESYEYGWILFGKLRQAIVEDNKTEAVLLVKDFITKDWYKEHKNEGWYNSHNSIHDIYYGYWSFETAAVVKIMGLDDSSFRDCKYYPKDLVNI